MSASGPFGVSRLSIETGECGEKHRTAGKTPNSAVAEKTAFQRALPNNPSVFLSTSYAAACSGGRIKRRFQGVGVVAPEFQI
jgi:hypothetical protein